MDIITGGCGWEGTMGWVDGQDGYGYRLCLGWAGIVRGWKEHAQEARAQERGSTFSLCRCRGPAGVGRK